MKKFGAVNAINLDGGGSSTLVINNTLVNYPSDWWYDIIRNYHVSVLQYKGIQTLKIVFFFFFFLNPFPNKPWFLRVCSTSHLKKQREKEKLPRDEQFLLFPQCFLHIWRNFLPFSSNLKLSSVYSFSLEESKICRLGKG